MREQSVACGGRNVVPPTAVLLLLLGFIAVVAGLVALVALPQVVRWAWRTMRTRSRLSRGLCIDCGYNLTGVTEPRCPECGQPFNLMRDTP